MFSIKHEVVETAEDIALTVIGVAWVNNKHTPSKI